MYSKEQFLELMQPLHGTWTKKAYSKLSRKMSSLLSSLKKRSLENSVECTVTSHQIRELFHKTYGESCRYCKNILNLRNIACDHIIPLSKSGPTTIENLQLICKSCNTRKGPLDERDFEMLIMLVLDLPSEISAYVMKKLAKGGRY